MSHRLAVEEVVRERYSDAARSTQESSCCATTYDPALLEVISSEVVERDYGCGNPTPYVQPSYYS